jgi:transcriptional regulator with XRE-family HTH domain
MPYIRQPSATILSTSCGKKMDSLPLLRYFCKANSSDMSQNSQLGTRITTLRKGKNWSQSELASHVGISYAQIGRYETKGAQPPAEVLKKIADALDSTVDFLVNGDNADKAKAALQDAEVIRYFKEVDALPQEDKSALLRVIAGFIRDVKTKQAYAS